MDAVLADLDDNWGFWSLHLLISVDVLGLKVNVIGMCEFFRSDLLIWCRLRVWLIGSVREYIIVNYIELDGWSLEEWRKSLNNDISIFKLQK